MPGPVAIRSFLAVLSCAASALVVGVEASAAEGSPTTLLQKIDKARESTWRWQRVMGRSLTRSSHSARRVTSSAYRRWVLDLWRERAGKARKTARNPPRESAWLCIHRHEGPWNANTGNGYYGGLQMDLAFQRRYGASLLRRKGRADGWTALEQIWVAERAYRSGRGFYPWPNTARACSLL